AVLAAAVRDGVLRRPHDPGLILADLLPGARGGQQGGLVRSSRDRFSRFPVTPRTSSIRSRENAADSTPSEMWSVRRPLSGSGAPVTAATYRSQAHRPRHPA